MQVKWKKLIVKTTVWLFIEVLFSFLGLDNLADYSEFVFEKYLADSDSRKSSLIVDNLAMTTPGGNSPDSHQ
ncbi:hypothetical protein [Pleurocapsa sp. PCC 7319]|uniref:hypothetical protein n=1 Tax=Pleurocapsa sp. PCC 7319 TaxID=118161 RepID=UPI00034C85BF|nr:hypothetical protein [Pleurocapsa sp. PCC 7319]